MKNLIKLIALCLIPVAAWGQSSSFIRNDSASTTLIGTNLDPGVAAVNSKGELYCTVGTAAASLGKAEDAAHASGDVGVMSLGVINTNGTNLAATEGDYTAFALNNKGTQYVDINSDLQTSATKSLLKLEDVASATGDALVATAITRNDALAVTADTDGDYQVQKGDTVGRTITTLAPAGESFQACTGSITNTTQTDIKAAVASNRIYVTSIGCNNTATVASTLVFGDGASTIWQGAIGNSTLNGVAGYTMTFPVPLRTTANTAFTVTLGTTATATRCCAAGYISVN